MSDSPRSRRAVAIVAGTVLLALAVVYWFRDVFGPLLLALAFAYILEPVVARIERKGRSRLFAVSVIFLAGGLLMLLLAVGLVLQAFELVEWLTRPDGLVEKGVDNLVALLDQHRERLERLRLADRATDPEFWKAIVEPLARIVETTLGGVLSTFTLVGVLLLLPVYQFYVMVELPDLWHWTKQHLPARDRERSLRVLDQMHKGFSAFLRGRVVIAVLKGAVTALGLWLVGAPVALLLGLGAGLLSILPFVGPVLGWVIASVAMLAHDPGVLPLVWVAVVFVVAELIENFVLYPWVMKEGVSLHPLTVLFSIVFWAAALGLFGALISIPLTLVAKILLREYVLPSVDRLAAEG